MSAKFELSAMLNGGEKKLDLHSSKLLFSPSLFRSKEHFIIYILYMYNVMYHSSELGFSYITFAFWYVVFNYLLFCHLSFYFPFKQELRDLI